MYVMEVSLNEKDNLATYQLKDVAETWYTQLKYNNALRAGPVSLEISMKDFLDRFFPREKREAKVEQLIKLHQEGTSVKENAFKFIKLSKYASSMVSNARDKRSRQ